MSKSTTNDRIAYPAQALAQTLFAAENIPALASAVLTTAIEAGLSQSRPKQNMSKKRNAAPREKLKALLSQLESVPAPRRVKSAFVTKATRRGRGNRSAARGGTMSASAAPVALGNRIRLAPPRMTGKPFGSDGSIIVEHTEYITDVPGSVNFAVQTYPLNPGMPTFPWASTYVAPGYEYYEVLELDFMFMTEQATSMAGSCMLAFDPDASDGPPVSKTALMSYERSTRASCWENATLKLTRPLLNRIPNRLVRQGVNPTGTDIKLYDAGNLYFATQGCGSTANMGELYIRYKIKFTIPQLNLGNVAFTNSLRINASAGVSAADPWGTAPTYTGGLSVFANGGMITFQKPGQYLVEITFVGTGMTGGAYTLGPAVGGATYSTINGGNTAGFTGGASGIGTLLLTINSPGDGVDLSLVSSATTVTSTVTRIAPYAVVLA